MATFEEALALIEEGDCLIEEGHSQFPKRVFDKLAERERQGELHGGVYFPKDGPLEGYRWFGRE